MHPFHHAATDPTKPAAIFEPSGVVLTYGDLDRRSNQLAHALRAAGLRPGDTIAMSMESCPAFFIVAWAAQRSGLYYVAVSNKLQFDEVTYILADSGARAFFTSSALNPLPRQIAEARPDLMLFSVDQAIVGFRDLRAELGLHLDSPIEDQRAGYDMLYSSGTTGRPKGIKPRHIADDAIDAPDGVAQLAVKLYGADSETVYLCPAPLYHAAPLRWCMAMMRLGGTAVILERFDAALALQVIERHKVTMAQFVPTHFIRMLKLQQDERERYDHSSLRIVIHAAAPCPVPVKEAMIDWLGPIIHEYYSGSEGNGGTFITPQEWLSHKGSVGRPLTTSVHICDEEGNELPARSEGQIFFSGGPTFEYHNDREKTDATRHARGWTTLGDIGWVDEDGYLYLTDRKSFMIISGGVNIYPQEIENLLVTHPKVADVAVIGAPDPEMGERVVAIVQPMVWSDRGDALSSELNAFARSHLSHVKVPRQIDFMEELPRHATGKLYKRILRDAYWAGASTAPAA